MAANDLDDDFARELRRAWFRFLDGVEPYRKDLHRYALALTGNIWSAEDLAQETLLRAYAVLGRGDLHGDGSRLRSLRGYLLRTASNLWIDQIRKARREARLEQLEPSAAPDAEAKASVRDAAVRLLRDLPPKERAAVVLKDVFDLSLEEIAELLSTTPGAVKSALHRARERLGAPPPPTNNEGPSPALVKRFIAAFEARDAAALSAVLLSTVTVEVPGVGGGRGAVQTWVDISIQYPPDRIAEAMLEGERVLLMFDGDGDREVLSDVLRLEEDDGRVAKLTDYYFAPDTLALAAERLGVAAKTSGYHQDAETLVDMIATTGAPWIEP